MRACELAKAGNENAVTAKRTKLSLDGVCMIPPGCYLIRTRFRGRSCKNWVYTDGNRQKDNVGEAYRSLYWSISGSWVRAHFHDAEGSGSDHIDHRAVIVNLLQDGLYGLQFSQISTAGLILHALQLVIESQLLVAVKVSHA